MSEERSDDGDFDQLNSSLKQGLKTCRSVVANYRALLLSNDNEPRDNNLDEDLELGSGGD